MKSLIPFLALVLLPVSGLADYLPVSFADLAGTSEVIAAGTITSVQKETFELRIEDAIFGPATKCSTITVRQFRDWPCAWRWSKYEVNQKVLVFVNFDLSRKEWRIRGSGCEGDSPIVDDDVLVNFGVPGPRIEYGTRNSHLTPVSYKQLRAAIVDFRAEYRLTPAKEPWRKVGEDDIYVPVDRIQIIALASTSQFRPRRPPPKELRQRSAVHRFLAESLDEEWEKMKKTSAQSGEGKDRATPESRVPRGRFGLVSRPIP